MITNKFKWISYKLTNQNDEYGKACIDCAERVMNFLDKAEKFNYYDVDFLNQRKKETYMLKVRFFLIKKEFINAFFTARKAFSYSKPITLNQKILYIVSLSFLNHKNEK